MTIRSYHHQDAKKLAGLFYRSITQIAAQFYTPAQIAVWAPRLQDSEKLHSRFSDGRWAWVAVDDNDNPIGFIDLEVSGHIDFLYCDPDWAGKGVAFALYQHLEKVARREGISRLFTEASEAARPFFQRQGFKVVHRRDFELDGVMIFNYKMTKEVESTGC